MRLQLKAKVIYTTILIAVDSWILKVYSSVVGGEMGSYFYPRAEEFLHLFMLAGLSVALA